MSGWVEQVPLKNLLIFGSTHIACDGNMLSSYSCWKATSDHDTTINTLHRNGVTSGWAMFGLGQTLWTKAKWLCFHLSRPWNLFPKALRFSSLNLDSWKIVKMSKVQLIVRLIRLFWYIWQLILKLRIKMLLLTRNHCLHLSVVLLQHLYPESPISANIHNSSAKQIISATVHSIPCTSLSFLPIPFSCFWASAFPIIFLLEKKLKQILKPFNLKCFVCNVICVLKTYNWTVLKK